MSFRTYCRSFLAACFLEERYQWMIGKSASRLLLWGAVIGAFGGTWDAGDTFLLAIFTSWEAFLLYADFQVRHFMALDEHRTSSDQRT